MKLKRGLSLALGLGVVMASALPVTSVFATAPTYSDGGNSEVTVSVDATEGITTLNIDFKLDDTMLAKILAQKSGNGSYVGDYYATINSGFDDMVLTNGEGGAKVYRTNFSYEAGEEDDYDTTAEIEARYAALCEAGNYYYYGCNTLEHWYGSALAQWDAPVTVFYRTEHAGSGWAAAYWTYVGEGGSHNAWDLYRVDGGTHPQISIGDRLAELLGKDKSELQYGVDWMIRANNYGGIWIYRDNYTNPTVSKYLNVVFNVENAFDYAGTNDNVDFVRYESFEAALAGSESTVIVNKNTTIDRLIIPEGKTVVERNGVLTVNDPVHSQILGTYQRQDGKNYKVVKLQQAGPGLAQIEDQFVAVGEEAVIDIQVNEGCVVVSQMLDDVANPTGKFMMPDWDVLYAIEFGPAEIDFSEMNDGDGVFVEFGEALHIDRSATLSVEKTVDEGALGALELTGDGKLIGAMDFKVLIGDEVVEVEDNEVTVRIYLDEEWFEMLSQYDRVQVVYFNDDGVEEERLDAVLESGEIDDEMAYWLEFETTHLSTYGVVGVNDEEETAAPETGRFTKTEDYAKDGGKMGVLILAMGMLVLGYGMVSLGRDYQTRERNTKE